MTRYIGLAEYLWLAEQVTGIEVPVLAKAGRMDLADSTLHAPQGAFDGVEFYPDLIARTARSALPGPGEEWAVVRPRIADEMAG